MKKIPLTQGQIAIIDDEDFEKVNQFVWHARWSKGSFYVQKNNTCPFTKKRSIVKLEHFLIGKPEKGFIVDHINTNPLDNRRENLRLVTNHQNQFNQRPHRNSGSKYIGVSFDKRSNGKWRAYLRFNGKVVYSKQFDSEEAAALARNEAAKKYFGDCAKLNVIGVDGRIRAEKGERNVFSRKFNSTGYKGVYFSHKKWVAEIIANSKKIYLGRFETPEAAALAFNAKSIELYGDKAFLNKVDVFQKEG